MSLFLQEKHRVSLAEYQKKNYEDLNLGFLKLTEHEVRLILRLIFEMTMNQRLGIVLIISLLTLMRMVFQYTFTF